MQFLLAREKDIDVFATGRGLAQRPADDRAIPEGLRWRVGNGLATGIRSSNNPIGRKHEVNGQPGSVGAGHSHPSRERLRNQGAHLLPKTARALFAAHAGLRGYLCVQHVSCKPPLFASLCI